MACLYAQGIFLPGPASFPLKGPSEAPVALRSWAEHDAIVAKADFPYRIRFEGALVLGVHPHINHADDPQIAVLDKEWAALRPTVILVEGRPGIFFGKEEDLVSRIGEPGWAMRRAQKEKLKIWSWEPSVEAETTEMLKHGTKQDAVLMLTLRSLATKRRNGPISDDDAAASLTRRQANYGLKDAFVDLAAMESFWTTNYGRHGDWRSVPEGWNWAGAESPLFKMSAAVGDLRTSNMVRCVRELAAQGERILALCGSGHAIRGEKALANRSL